MVGFPRESRISRRGSLRWRTCGSFLPAQGRRSSVFQGVAAGVRGGERAPRTVFLPDVPNRIIATGPPEARKILSVRNLGPETIRRALAALMALGVAPLAAAGRPAPARRHAGPLPGVRGERSRGQGRAPQGHQRGADGPRGTPPRLRPPRRQGGRRVLRGRARNRTVGHWDLAGRAPYLRWALAGGIDHHAQNFASESRRGFEFTEPAAELLKKMHEAFMAERPPTTGTGESSSIPAGRTSGSGSRSPAARCG